MRVPGNVVLVTGASSGIGRATAALLGQAGATLLVHGRDPRRTAAVAREVGGTPLLIDLAEPGAADELAGKAVAVHGHVDVLVGSAGVGRSATLAETPEDDVRHIVEVDLVAPLLLTRALLPGMVERGHGHLLYVGSVAGRTGVAGEATYAAAKAGLDAFAESLRLELAGSGVGVSLVLPGAVDTPFVVGRGRPHDRSVPRPVSAEAVARSVMHCLEHETPESWVPGWLRLAPVVRAVAPSAYRRLAARYGEPVRARRRGR